MSETKRFDPKKFKENLEFSIWEVKENKAGKVNSLLCPTLVGCDPDTMSAEFRFNVDDRLLNRAGQLHGGMAAAMFDFSMGVLTRHAIELTFAPTIELNITYFRPVMADEDVIIRAKVENAGSRITHLSAEMFIEKTGKRAAIGKAMFFNKNTAEK